MVHLLFTYVVKSFVNHKTDNTTPDHHRVIYNPRISTAISRELLQNEFEQRVQAGAAKAVIHFKAKIGVSTTLPLLMFYLL
jgi:hypothetical protein